MRRGTAPRRVVAGAMLAAAVASGSQAPAAAQPADGEQRVLLRIRDERITESSGLSASRRHHGVVWTHNDSGDEARVYGVGPDGRVVAVLRLAGLVPRDWEAMAPGRGPGQGTAPSLWIGDIGDNSATRTNGILVHHVDEPAELRAQKATATSYRLRYPDGPRDAEALLVHPVTGRLLVVTKGLVGGALYEAPERLDASAPNVLRCVGEAPPVVTDGAYLPDGRLVLRTYTRAYLYAGVDDLEGSFALPEQEQGESVAAGFTPGTALVGSEGTRSEVWEVGVRVEPDTSSLTESPSPERIARASAPGRSEDPGRGPRLVIASALLAGAVGVAAVRRRRRSGVSR